MGRSIKVLDSLTQKADTGTGLKYGKATSCVGQKSPGNATQELIGPMPKRF